MNVLRVINWCWINFDKEEIIGFQSLILLEIFTTINHCAELQKQKQIYQIQSEQEKTRQKFESALRFTKNNNIVIVEADKGVKTFVMTKDNYKRMTTVLLEDSETYKLENKYKTNSYQRLN